MSCLRLSDQLNVAKLAKRSLGVYILFSVSFPLGKQSRGEV